MGEMGGFDAVALQKYHWVEQIDHVHTPGNSSGIVDGAVAGRDRQRADRQATCGLTPRARILATAVSGADPTIMLTGPAPATRKALAKAGITIDDLDLVEINEAFAAVVLRFVRDMGLDLEKVNVNGGAIAMGHPLGATGGDDPRHAGRRAATAPAATLRAGHACVGGGMGIATVVERDLDGREHNDSLRAAATDGIVILTLDDPNQSANTMNAAYVASMAATVERLEAEKDEIKGVVLTSAKKTFFAGGDLNDLKQVRPEHAAELRRGPARDQGPAAPPGDARHARSSPRSTARRSGGGLEIALASPPPDRRRRLQGRSSASPRSSSACCRAVAASSARSACSASPTR